VLFTLLNKLHIFSDFTWLDPRWRVSQRGLGFDVKYFQLDTVRSLTDVFDPIGQE